MARRKKYAGRRRHPSSCLKSSSPMKYMSREETDLSDGIQAGAMRDEETGKVNWDQMGKLLGPGGVKNARNAKFYNEGFEDSDMDAMDDLDDMSFS